MKTKLSLLIVLFCIAGTSYSQPYIPVLDNASWIIKQYFFGGSQTSTISQNGEQTIGSHTYKNFVNSLTSEQFLLREDVATRKVYKYVNGSEQLLFDFSLNVSDNIFLGGQSFTVAQISNINVDGGQRRQWYLNNNGAFGSDEMWVEGVGGKQHPLKGEYEMIIEQTYLLQCSSQNGTFIYNMGLANGGTPTDCLALGTIQYDYADKITFSPNPFHDEMAITVTSGLNNASVKIFSSSGQLVRELTQLNGEKISVQRGNLSNGLYLVQVFENEKLLTSEKVLIN